MKKYDNKKIYLFLIPVFLLAVVFASFSVITQPAYVSSTDSSSDDIHYRGSVCTSITKADGTYIDNGCNHNLLYTNGKNMIQYLIAGDANSGLVKGLIMCNASAGCGVPVAANTEPFTAFDGCGLQNVSAATYASNGNAAGGNWSIYTTFTSTCDNVLTNSTRLTNASYSYFAGNTFSLVTLQTNDQLTVNWTISVS
jgi:hypothetical protein